VQSYKTYFGEITPIFGVALMKFYLSTLKLAQLRQNVFRGLEAKA
jgi:hypothetical protein